MRNAQISNTFQQSLMLVFKKDWFEVSLSDWKSYLEAN